MTKVDKTLFMLPIEEVEAGAREQLEDIASKDFVKKIVVCPDVHKGYGVPIGAVVLMDGVISPMCVGFDCSCGVYHVTTDIDAEYFLDMVDLAQVEDKIRQDIPMGGRRHDNLGAGHFISASGDKELGEKVSTNAVKQLGTLGGKTSNHFIEIGVVEGKKKIGVTIHSGSRNPGYVIAEYYLKKYGDYLKFQSPEGQAYYQDMLWAGSWASLNRTYMMRQTLTALGLDDETICDLLLMGKGNVHITHNYAEETPEGILHRKGATPAYAGQMGLIPGDMASGVYIVRGLGNADYLNSCSHGAGRVLGRNKAKKTLLLSDFQAVMEKSGVRATVTEAMLEESPDCYKNLDQVIAYQDGIVFEVVDKVKPLLNIKG